MDSENQSIEAYNAVIQSLTAAKQWEEALSVFNEVQFGGDVSLQGNEETYSLALAASSVVGCWQATLEILEATRRHNMPLGTGQLKDAVSCCCKAGCWQGALALLEELQLRGHAEMSQYTSVISVLGQLRPRQAVEVYDQMQKQFGIPPLEVPSHKQRLESQLQERVACGDWPGTLHLFHQLRATDDTWKPAGQIAAALATACAQTRLPWQQALHLSELPEAWPSVARSCAAGKQWHLALEMLEKMKQKGVQGDSKTYGAVVKACADASCFSAAQGVFEDMRKQGLEPTWTVGGSSGPDVHSVNAALAACEGSGAWQRALQIFQDMEGRIRPNVHTYRALMSVCNSAGQWQHALHILRSSHMHPVPVELQREQLRAMDAGQQWPKALELWQELSRGQPKDPTLQGLGASSLQRAGRWQEALRILQRLPKPLDATALSAASSCYAQKEEWSETRQALKEMKQRQLTPDDRALRAGIEASAAILDWQEALKLLMQMEDQSATATVLRSMCSCQQWAEALELCRRHKQKGLELDVATLRMVTELLGAEGQWSSVSELFGDLRRREELGSWWNSEALDEKRQQRSAELNAAIGSARRWQDALELWQKMKAERLSPQRRVVDPLLRASCEASWQTALGTLEELQHLEPSSDAISLVIRCCARGGAWQEALRLLEQGKATAAAHAAVIRALPADQPQLVAQVYARMATRPAWASAAPATSPGSARSAAAGLSEAG